MPSYVCDHCHRQLGSDLAVIHNGSLIHLTCKGYGPPIDTEARRPLINHRIGASTKPNGRKGAA